LDPFIKLYIHVRKARGMEDNLRFRERFGITEVKRPEGKVIWFNAVSIGEINSAWSVINRLNQETDCNILITTTTKTSSDIVENKIQILQKPERVVHQFFPVDTTSCVKRFLEHWKPSILVNVESEIWPNMLTLTKKFCPILILNGKMSKKSFRFWYVMKKLKEQVFDGVELCLAQSKRDLKRFINLGLQQVQFLGNIKFFVDKQPVDVEYLNFLKNGIGNRKFWLVNCTHEGEEDIIVKTHKLLKENCPDIFTINIIRHPKRSEDVANLIAKAGLKASIASRNDPINRDVDFYVYDKIGDLGTFFELSEIVFIAGSLKQKIGGHTPAECIKYGCCVVSGPYIDNNKILFRDLLDNDACVVLKDNNPVTLSKKVNELLENDALRNHIISEAYTKSIKSASYLGEIVNKISDMAV
jgi:3-deoxy-D-manno-octulosonic-acid transferase